MLHPNVGYKRPGMNIDGIGTDGPTHMWDLSSLVIFQQRVGLPSSEFNGKDLWFPKEH